MVELHVIQGRGVSKSTLASQKRWKGLWEEFRAQTPAAGLGDTAWGDLDVAQLTDEALYGSFAGWLTKYATHKTNASKAFSADTVHQAVYGMNNFAKKKFLKHDCTDATRSFFTCLDIRAHAPARDWLLGVKDNISRDVFQRDMQAGVPMNKAAKAICFSQMTAICRAYTQSVSHRCLHHTRPTWRSCPPAHA